MAGRAYPADAIRTMVDNPVDRTDAVRAGIPVVGLRTWTVLDADGRALADAVPAASSPEDAVRQALGRG